MKTSAATGDFHHYPVICIINNLSKLPVGSFYEKNSLNGGTGGSCSLKGKNQCNY